MSRQNSSSGLIVSGNVARNETLSDLCIRIEREAVVVGEKLFPLGHVRLQVAEFLHSA